MTCPECRDTGVYTGFLVVEPCSRGCEPPRPWIDWDHPAFGMLRKPERGAQ